MTFADIETSNKTKVFQTPEEAKLHISKSFEEFSSWSTLKIKYIDKIYDVQGNEISNLYYIVNNKGIAGYLILDKTSNNIKEFALGEPAYKAYLKKYKEKKQYFNKENKLIQNGAVHAVTFDNFNTINYFTLEANLDIEVDFRSAIDLEHNNDMIFQSETEPGPIKEYKILYDVPDNANGSAMPACGPMSAINISYYWSNHGYPNLTQNKSMSTIYSLYYYFMGSFGVPGTNGQHATSPLGPYQNGFESYFDQYNYDLSVTSNFTVSTSNFDFWIKSPILNNRPGIILFNDASNYGLHYAVNVGYGIDYYGDRYYVYNPLRNTPQIWRNFDNDVSTNDIIWGVFRVTPHQENFMHFRGKSIYLFIIITIIFIVLIVIQFSPNLIASIYYETKLGIQINETYGSYNSMILEELTATGVKLYIYPLVKYKKIFENPFVIELSEFELLSLKKIALEHMDGYSIQTYFPELDDTFFDSDQKDIYPYLNYKYYSDRIEPFYFSINVETNDIVREIK
ncbi:hypothetical protein [Fusibacter bizertensis]